MPLPVRIDQVLTALRQTWSICPEKHLCQLITDVLDLPRPLSEFSVVKDEELLRKLQTSIEPPRKLPPKPIAASRFKAARPSIDSGPRIVVRQSPPSPMKKVAAGEKTYLVAHHINSGVVIEDPDYQVNVAPDMVRLYIVREKRMAKFKRASILDLLALEGFNDELTQGLRIYLEFLETVRHTHCWKCKRSLNSIDFSVCSSCNWIRCTCGACYLGSCKDD